jgi:hypothetical protein
MRRDGPESLVVLTNGKRLGFTVFRVVANNAELGGREGIEEFRKELFPDLGEPFGNGGASGVVNGDREHERHASDAEKDDGSVRVIHGSTCWIKA